MSRKAFYAYIGLGLIVVAVAAIGILSRIPAVGAYLVAHAVRERLAEPIDPSLFDGKALRLILCGTSSPLPDPHRAKACAIVIAGERAYVVDTGPESWKTMALMGFPGERIAGVMLTHFPLRPHRRPRRIPAANLDRRAQGAVAGLWRSRRRQGGGGIERRLRAG